MAKHSAARKRATRVATEVVSKAGTLHHLPTTKALLLKLSHPEPVKVTLYKESDVAARAKLADIIAKHWHTLPDALQDEIRALLGKRIR